MGVVGDMTPVHASKRTDDTVQLIDTNHMVLDRLSRAEDHEQVRPTVLSKE